MFLPRPFWALFAISSLVTFALGQPLARLLVNTKFSGNVAGFSALASALQTAQAANPNTIIVGHGDSIGGSNVVSKILTETPSALMQSLLGFRVDTFGNNNFNAGLNTLASLLPSITAGGTKFVVSNVPNGTVLSPFVAPWVVVTVPSGAKVAFVGVLSDSDKAVIDQNILVDVPFAPDVASLIAARNEVVATQSPDYVVGLFSHHASARADALAWVTPWATNFDVICLGYNRDDAFITTVNGVLVVSGREGGASYVRVDLGPGAPTATAVSVSSSLSTATTALHASLWSTAATCTGSAVRAQIDRQIFARSRTAGTNGLRWVKNTESPLAHLWLQAMMDMTNATLGLVNTGAFRDDLPSSFAPSSDTPVKRPVNGTIGPFDSVSGDCPIIMPFGNTVQYVDVSSAEVCAMARWAATGEINPVGAVGIVGLLRGVEVGVTYNPDLTSVVHYVRWLDGRDVDCTLNSDSHRMALSSFVSTGGDGAPIPLRPIVNLPRSDSEVMCNAIAKAKGLVALETFLTGALSVTRVERSCGQQALLMTQAHATFTFSPTTFEEYGVTLNDTADCVSVSMSVLKAENIVSPVRAALSSISTTFAAPNQFAVLHRRANPIALAGQVWGNAVNLTVNAPNVPPLTPASVLVCIPARPESLPLSDAFSEDRFAISQNGSVLFVEDSIQVTRSFDSSGTLLFCGNVSVPTGVPFVVAPARAAPFGSNYSPVEQAFLFLFGIAWLVVAIYGAVLLVHSIYLTLQNEKEDLELWDFLLPANWVRLELIIIGLCRFLYFVLLPWNILPNNPVGAAFLFEFPFLLDLSIYTIFVSLFIQIFHWKTARTLRKAAWVAPLIIINGLLVCFFFSAIAVYSLADTYVVERYVLAYRITLAATAFLVVVAFGIYGIWMLIKVRKTLSSDDQVTRPEWVAQMKRLSLVCALASAGMLAIFIVIVYNAVQVVPNPVFASVAWLILFLLFAEMIPLLAIAHDLYITAVQNEATLRGRRDTQRVTSQGSVVSSDGAGTPGGVASLQSDSSRERKGSLSSRKLFNLGSSDGEGGGKSGKASRSQQSRKVGNNSNASVAKVPAVVDEDFSASYHDGLADGVVEL